MSADILKLELDEFIESAVCRGEIKNITHYEKAQAECETLATQLGNMPQLIVHRDFHSKNVMIDNNEFYIIDSQDACLGPYLYDIASLLFDPYTQLNQQQRQQYADDYRSLFIPEIDAEKFHQDLALIGAQRVLKAAARYATLYYKKGKDSHLPFMQPALKTAKELLSAQGCYEALIKAIEHAEK